MDREYMKNREDEERLRKEARLASIPRLLGENIDSVDLRVAWFLVTQHFMLTSNKKSNQI